MLVQEHRNIAQCTEPGCRYNIYGDKNTVLRDATTHSRVTGHKVNVVLGSEKDSIARMRDTSCPNCGKGWDLHEKDTCPARNVEGETRDIVNKFKGLFQVLDVDKLVDASETLDELIAESGETRIC